MIQLLGVCAVFIPHEYLQDVPSLRPGRMTYQACTKVVVHPYQQPETVETCFHLLHSNGWLGPEEINTKFNNHYINH